MPRSTQGETSSVGTRIPSRVKLNPKSGNDLLSSGAGTPIGGGTWSSAGDPGSSPAKSSTNGEKQGAIDLKPQPQKKKKKTLSSQKPPWLELAGGEGSDL